MYFETECITAVQGQPRSMILVQLKAKRVQNFLLVINSNLASTLPRFRDITDFLLSIVTDTSAYSTQLLGICPLDQIADVGPPRIEDPKLITRVINFELSSPPI